MKFFFFLLILGIVTSFSFSSFSLIPKKMTIRDLLDSSIKEKVCTNMDEKLIVSNESSLINYVNKQKFSENKAKKLVMSLLTEGKAKGVSDLIPDVAIWVVMIVLAGIILLSK